MTCGVKNAGLSLGPVLSCNQEGLEKGPVVREGSAQSTPAHFRERKVVLVTNDPLLGAGSEPRYPLRSEVISG